MQLFHMRNPVRYLVVSADDGGPVIMFEGDFGHQKLTEELGTITEIRPPVATTSVATMSRQQDKLREWVRDMTSVLRPITSSIGSNRIGLEPRFSGEGTIGLQEAGFDVVDAQRSLELAGCIKTPEELLAIRQGMNVVAEGVNRMRDSLRPGLSENEFWGILHKTLIEEDGEYVETRLGHRTNPWFQECGSKIIENGELVALDTDCVGPFSYYIDFSRTFLCGDAQPTAVQSHLYQQATEQIYHNMSLIRPGREFFDFVKKSWPIPPEYNKNAYHVQTHGVGMTGEYPYIMHPEDLADHQYPGTIEAGMTLCVESYIGDEAGGEGVKLEEHVLVHEDGVEILSCDCPLESIFY